MLHMYCMLVMYILILCIVRPLCVMDFLGPADFDVILCNTGFRGKTISMIILLRP